MNSQILDLTNQNRDLRSKISENENHAPMAPTPQWPQSRPNGVARLPNPNFRQLRLATNESVVHSTTLNNQTKTRRKRNPWTVDGCRLLDEGLRDVPADHKYR